MAHKSMRFDEKLLYSKISAEVRSLRRGDILVWMRKRKDYEYFLLLEDREIGMAFVQVLNVKESKTEIINLASFTQNRLKIIRAQDQ